MILEMWKNKLLKHNENDLTSVSVDAVGDPLGAAVRQGDEVAAGGPLVVSGLRVAVVVVGVLVVHVPVIIVGRGSVRVGRLAVRGRGRLVRMVGEGAGGGEKGDGGDDQRLHGERLAFIVPISLILMRGVADWFRISDLSGSTYVAKIVTALSNCQPRMLMQFCH